MRITSVEYSRLVTFGHFENQRIGATAKVDYDTDGSPENVMEQLRLWVNDQLQQTVVMNDLKEQVRYEENGARSTLREIERNIEEAKVRWQKAKEFLNLHGVKTEDIDLPF